MKTIQIPLELAEEIIEAVEATDNRQPEWYHKLKKLVEEQTTGTVEKNENGEMYKVWRFPKTPSLPNDLLPD